MTINSFHDSQFHALVNHHIAYVEINQCTCRDMISRALRHAPGATQKGVADLCLYHLQLMYEQMYVHTGIKDFLAT